MGRLRHFQPMVLCMITLFCSADWTPLTAREPGWSGVIVARGSYRQRLLSTPIEHRPYRPLHFYGNMRRRQYYRGTPAPTVEDLSQAVYHLSRGEWLAGTPRSY